MRAIGNCRRRQCPARRYSPGVTALSNTEHLDVIDGFEGRFAKDPPRFDAPLLLVTPTDGEASAENESSGCRAAPTPAR